MWLGATNRSITPPTPTPPPPGGAVKWNPGQGVESDAVLTTGSGLSVVKSEIDAIANLDNVISYMILITWGNLQQTAGTYTFANLDGIINYLTNRAGNSAMHIPKHYAIQVVGGAFTSTHPNGSVSIVPGYIQNNVAQYGTGGYRLTGAALTAIPAVGATGGTLTASWVPPTQSVAIKFKSGESHTATLTQGSTTINWSGGIAATQTSATINFSVTTVISGASGWWGGDGNGNTYGAALWRPNVMAEWIKLHQALAARYESDPLCELIYQGEDSFYQGTGSTNGSDYNDTTQLNNWLNFLQAQCTAWPTTIVGFSETFLQFQNNSVTLTNNITNGTFNNHPPVLAQTDSLGAVQRSAIHTWGTKTYAGVTPGFGSLGDRRSTGRFIAEIQAPDQGFFQNMGSPREDVLAGLNIMRCTHTFWAIVPSPTNLTTKPAKYPVAFASLVSGTSGSLAAPWPLVSGTYDLASGAGAMIVTKGSSTAGFTTSQPGTATSITINYPLVPYNWSNGGTSSAAQNGTTRSYTDTGLLAWINDPAQALLNTAYPPDFP